MSQSNMNFHNELYQSLREFYGSIKTIAERTGLSRESVRWALLGKTKNNQVIIEAGKVLAELREERSKAIQFTRKAMRS